MTNAAQQIHSALGVDDAAFTKQLKGTQSWGELVLLEDKIREQIASSANLAREVMYLCSAEQVVNAEMRALVAGVMNDLKQFAERLNIQRSKRKGRTSAINGPDEYADYIAVGLELTSLSENMQVVVGATLMDLTEYQHAALERVRIREAEAKAAQDAVDTAVVTDVEEKTVTEELTQHVKETFGENAEVVSITETPIPDHPAVGQTWNGGIDQEGLNGQWTPPAGQSSAE